MPNALTGPILDHAAGAVHLLVNMELSSFKVDIAASEDRALLRGAAHRAQQYECWVQPVGLRASSRNVATSLIVHGTTSAAARPGSTTRRAAFRLTNFNSTSWRMALVSAETSAPTR